MKYYYTCVFVSITNLILLSLWYNFNVCIILNIITICIKFWNCYLVIDVLLLFDILFDVTILMLYVNSFDAKIVCMTLLGYTIIINTIALCMISIRKSKINLSKSIHLDLTDWSCSICLESSRSMIVETHCLHVYHESCIMKWTTSNTTCPMCRTCLFCKP